MSFLEIEDKEAGKGKKRNDDMYLAFMRKMKCATSMVKQKY